MDVTSLLNDVRWPSYGVDDSSKTLNYGKSHCSPIASPTLWDEDSNRNLARDTLQKAVFWGARGAGVPQSDESDPKSTTGPPISPKHIQRTAFDVKTQSKRTSANFTSGVASQLSVQLSGHSLSCDDTQICLSRRTPQDHGTGFRGEISTLPTHKLSFSNSSFVSSDSPLSECHSRLSSVASVSGISSSSIPITEMPLIYTKRFEAQSPQLDLVMTAQLPSSPFTEERSAAKQDQLNVSGHVSTDRSDAVFDLQKLGQPAIFWDSLSAELTARPKYHKRATSAPLPDSHTTTPASATPNDRYSTSSSTQLGMDKSMTEGLDTQAGETKTIIPATCQDYQAFGERQANAAVDRLPAHAAILQSQAQISHLGSDITPLAQLAHDIAREASLEVLNPASMAPLEEEPRCMFVDDCQTGSQLRKAISHLFGRNKACTLRIPKHVWVYYCRKHYQRIRYRNAKTYPLNQMYLVKMQINRLQRWSDENQRSGTGPYIKLWTLALRKREQSRLDKEAGAGEEGDDESLEAPNNSAAPEWIIQRLGTGYSTEQMLEVANRLYLEIENGTLVQVPEVEFLPDIIEPEAGNIARLIKSRKQTRTVAVAVEAKVSKRRISEDAASIDQRESSLTIQNDAAEPVNPSRKRIRLSPFGPENHQQAFQMQLPSIAMSPYSNNHATTASTKLQSAVPRTLPAVPGMQMSSPCFSHGPVAHIYGLSSNELRRPRGLDDSYGRDQQHQNSAFYRADTESLFQRNRDDHNQRLPSISAHLAGTSDIRNENMAIPPFRGPWVSMTDDRDMRRPPRMRSYSDNVTTSQPVLEYPRPSSSGAQQFGMSYPTNDYPREQWPESGHGYALIWPQRSGAQQHDHYYDQVTRLQLDSLRAPAYCDPAKSRTSVERADQEARRY